MKADYLHQTCNALAAFTCLTYLSDIKRSVFICAISALVDIPFVYMLQPHLAKRTALIIHHAFVLLAAAMYMTDLKPNPLHGRQALLLVLLEITTPVVYLHNLFPTIVTSRTRNVLWLLTRIPLSACIVDQAIRERAPNLRVTLVALVSLTMCWTLGSSRIGKLSSIINYANPIIESVYKGDVIHLGLSLLGAAGSIGFYDSGYRVFDQTAILTHCAYFLGLRSPVCLALVGLCYSLHGSNTLAPNLIVTLATLRGVTLSALSNDMTSALAITCAYTSMGIVISACGGPMQCTYGMRVVWHASACLLIAMLIHVDSSFNHDTHA